VGYMMLLMKRLLILAILSVSSSLAVPLKPYNSGEFQAAQKDNRLIVLHFFKMGCHTCHVQTDFLKALKHGPDCSGCNDVIFFEVDVDDKASQGLMDEVGVATPTSLVILQGCKPLNDPVAGQTDPKKLLELINTATNLSFKD